MLSLALVERAVESEDSVSDRTSGAHGEVAQESGMAKWVGGSGPDPGDATPPTTLRPRINVEPALVGRMAELAVLNQKHRAVRDGTCSAIGIRGEAGVGKSRLLRHFAEDCRRRGTRVLTTRCAEGLAGPLLPVLRLLRHAASDETVPESARQRCLDEIGALSAEQGADEAAGRRVLLFLALTELIHDIAAGQPTVVMVDDVQWADPLTRQFLEYLADELADAPGASRVLLVLAERSAAPDPIVAARQVPWIRLANFDRPTLRLFVAGIGIANPSPELIDELHAATAGNALHALELLRQVVDDRLLVELNGLATTVDGLPSPTATGLVDTIVRRLDAMSDDARDAASAVAIAGDECELNEVAHILDCSVDDLSGPLREAVLAGVLAESGGLVRCEHPMYRQLLELELPSRRRTELHARAAAVLLPDADHDEVALRVAPHLVAMGRSTLVSERTAADVLATAARRSFALAAWEDAVRYFLEALNRSSSDLRSRGWLHYEAGRAAELSYDWVLADEQYRAALDIAERVDDVELAAWASIYQLHAGTVGGQRVLHDRVDTDSVERLIESLDVEHGASAIVARTQYSQTLAARSDLEAASRFAEEAIEMALRSGDDRSLVKAEMTAGLAASFALDVSAAIAHYRAGCRVAGRIGDHLRHGHALTRIALLELSMGRLTRAESTAREAWVANRRTRQWSDMSLIAAVLAQVALHRGAFSDVESWGRESEHYLELSDYPFVPGVLYPVLAVAHAIQGDPERARAAVDRLCARTGRANRATRQMVERFTKDVPSNRIVWNGAPRLPTLARLIGAAEAANDEDEMRGLLDAFERIPDPRVVIALGSVRSVPSAQMRLRHRLGIGSGTLARAEVARWSDERADLAWCLALIDVATSGTDAERDLADLTDARRVANRIGATAVVALADEVAHSIDPGHVLGQGSATPQHRTVMFVDMAGSTEIAVRSDQLYVHLMDREREIVRRRSVEWRGSEFGTAGDAILVSFRSIDAALSCALSIQADVDDSDVDGLGLKIGVATGPLLERDGQLYGHVVNLAARLSDHAAPGDVVAAQALVDDATGGFGSFGSRAVHLKGFSDPFDLVRVLPPDQSHHTNTTKGEPDA